MHVTPLAEKALSILSEKATTDALGFAYRLWDHDPDITEAIRESPIYGRGIASRYLGRLRKAGIVKRDGIKWLAGDVAVPLSLFDKVSHD